MTAALLPVSSMGSAKGIIDVDITKLGEGGTECLNLGGVSLDLSKKQYEKLFHFTVPCHFVAFITEMNKHNCTELNRNPNCCIADDCQQLRSHVLPAS